MAQPRLSAEDLQWRAESDARALAEAETIKQDKTRVKKAIIAAKRLALKAQQEANAIQTVVTNSSKQKVTKKSKSKGRKTSGSAKSKKIH